MLTWLPSLSVTTCVVDCDFLASEDSLKRVGIEHWFLFLNFAAFQNFLGILGFSFLK